MLSGIGVEFRVFYGNSRLIFVYSKYDFGFIKNARIQASIDLLTHLERGQNAFSLRKYSFFSKSRNSEWLSRAIDFFSNSSPRPFEPHFNPRYFTVTLRPQKKTKKYTFFPFYSPEKCDGQTWTKNDRIISIRTLKSTTFSSIPHGTI